MISSSSKRAAENGSTTSVCRSDDASSDGDGSPSDVVHPTNKKRSPARSGSLFFRKIFKTSQLARSKFNDLFVRLFQTPGMPGFCRLLVAAPSQMIRPLIHNHPASRTETDSDP